MCRRLGHRAIEAKNGGSIGIHNCPSHRRIFFMYGIGSLDDWNLLGVDGGFCEQSMLHIQLDLAP